jgi:glycosyltransferase involved in cell wall biosynthesis
VGLSGRQLDGKPRLIIVLNRFVIGGQAVDTIPLAFHLQQFFQVTILYGQKEVDEIEPRYLLQRYPGLQLKKISHLRRSINPLIDVVAFFRVLGILLRQRPHVVHTHGAKSGFIGRLASVISGVPVIVHTFHGHFFHSYFSPFISKLVARVERIVGKMTTAAIALSTIQKRDIVDVYGILPAYKVEVIPLGFSAVSEASPEALRQRFRSKYAVQDDHVAVGIVGRIVPVKNHKFFVEVVNAFSITHPLQNVIFFVVGDGELKQQVQNDLKAREIPFSNTGVSTTEKIVFTSWLYNMDEVMNGLDVVVLTSFNEGTPLSMIEAQYFERPLVSVGVGGVKDTMRENVTGFVAEPGDVDDFVNKLHLLTANSDLRKQMGAAGKRFVLDNFSKENELRMTKEFYFSLLHQKGYVSV